MKKSLIVAVSAVALVLVTASLPAEASCGAARDFSTLTPTGNIYIFTPGGPHANGKQVTDAFTGVFWSFGGCDSLNEVGGGDDIGTFGTYYWLYDGYVTTGGFAYGAQMLDQSGNGYNNWSQPGIDGCIDNGGLGAGDDAEDCMVVLLTDEVGGVGHFGLLAARSQSGSYRFNEAAGNADFNLAPIPKPSIEGSSAVGNDVSVTVSVPAPGSGLGLDCTGAQNAAIIDSFQITAVVVDRGLDVSTGTPQDTGISAAIGGDGVVLVDCSESDDQDVYLCATLNGGGCAVGATPFNTTVCSDFATRVECGPNLGDPIEIRPDKPREFKQRPARTRPSGARRR